MLLRALPTTWRALCLCGLLGACLGTARAIDLTSAGDWTRTVAGADLQAGAGSDLTLMYFSDPAVMSLAITGTIDNNDTWRVDIRCTDTEWDNLLTLAIRRSGDGVGGGAISTNGTYQNITTTNTTLFSGSGDRGGIFLQLRLTGMTVQVPPDTYSTTITFTVVDLGGSLTTVVD